MKPVYLEKSFGIDIHEESVALCLIGKQFKQMVALGYGFFQIPLLSDDRPADEKVFLETINKFLLKHKYSLDNIVISLPRSYISFSIFNLPAPNRKAIDSMIEFELERHCAAEPNTIYYTFQAHEIGENRFRIILASLKKEVADYYLNLLQKVNLRPSSVEVSTFANLNLIPAKDGSKEDIVTLIDMSPTAIETNVIKSGILEISRHTPIDASEFQPVFFQNELSVDQYEHLSKRMVQTLANEIQTCLDSCDRIEANESIEKIYLCGGGNLASILAERLEKESQVPCQTIQSLLDIASEETWDGPLTSINTAYSLGIQDLKKNWPKFNLLPVSLRPKKKKFNIKTTIGLALAAGLLIIAAFGVKFLKNEWTLNSLETQFQEVKSQVGEMEKVDLEFESLNQYLSIFKAIDDQSPLKLTIINELTQVIPQDTWLTEITIQKDKLEIKGFSKASSKLIPLLENSPLFYDPAFNGSIIKEKEGEKFTIKAALQKKL